MSYCAIWLVPLAIGSSSSDEGPTLETLNYTIRIGSTPTILYFDLYLYSAQYVYITSCPISSEKNNKMAERCAKVNEHTRNQGIPCLSI